MSWKVFWVGLCLNTLSMIVSLFFTEIKIFTGVQIDVPSHPSLRYSLTTAIGTEWGQHGPSRVGQFSSASTPMLQMSSRRSRTRGTQRVQSHLNGTARQPFQETFGSCDSGGVSINCVTMHCTLHALNILFLVASWSWLRQKLLSIFAVYLKF